MHCSAAPKVAMLRRLARREERKQPTDGYLGGRYMVVEYIRYSIDDTRAEAFEQAYRRAAEALKASEHCERYEVSRCSEDPSQRIVRIDWDSEQGHLSGFRQSPEFHK